MNDLSKRDALYNAILDTIKERAVGYNAGLVTAVLAEVSSTISMTLANTAIDTIYDRLNSREPRRYK